MNKGKKNQMVRLSPYERKVLKPLTNFIKNSPLYLDFIISSGSVRIFYRDNILPYVYSLDISGFEKQDTPVHDVIKKIKEEIIIPLYPKVKLRLVTLTPLSLEERVKYAENGQNIPFYREIVVEEEYYLDKVSFQQNTIILTDVRTRQKHRKYKSRLPLIFFNENLAKTKFFSGEKGSEDFAKLLEQDFDFISFKDLEEEEERGNKWQG